MLNINNLEFSYDKKLIFKDVSFSIDKGELILINGVSGVGKTTLVQIIAGYIKPLKGTIILDQHNITAKPNRDVILCSQNNILYPWLNIYDQLKFLIGNKKEKILYYLSLVGLENDLIKYPYELSGGMKKRLLLARALCVSPKVIILDEVFSSLDVLSKQRLFDLIKKIKNEMKTSFILISHVPIPNELIDYKYILKNKKVILEKE